jgi:hypothetical protein
MSNEQHCTSLAESDRPDMTKLVVRSCAKFLMSRRAWLVRDCAAGGELCGDCWRCELSFDCGHV